MKLDPGVRVPNPSAVNGPSTALGRLAAALPIILAPAMDALWGAQQGSESSTAAVGAHAGHLLGRLRRAVEALPRVMERLDGFVASENAGLSQLPDTVQTELQEALTHFREEAWDDAAAHVEAAAGLTSASSSSSPDARGAAATAVALAAFVDLRCDREDEARDRVVNALQGLGDRPRPLSLQAMAATLGVDVHGGPEDCWKAMAAAIEHTELKMLHEAEQTVIVRCMNDLAASLSENGLRESAHQAYQAALLQAKRCSLHNLSATIANNYATDLCTAGDRPSLELAMSLVRTELDALVRFKAAQAALPSGPLVSVADNLAYTYSTLGRVSLGLGQISEGAERTQRLHEAATALNQALEERPTRRPWFNTSSVYSDLVQVFLLRNDLGAAEGAAGQAWSEASAVKPGGGAFRAEAREALARVAAAKGDLPSTYDNINRALRYYAPTDPDMHSQTQVLAVQLLLRASGEGPLPPRLKASLTNRLTRAERKLASLEITSSERAFREEQLARVRASLEARAAPAS